MTRRVVRFRPHFPLAVKTDAAAPGRGRQPSAIPRRSKVAIRRKRHQAKRQLPQGFAVPGVSLAKNARSL
jgi:hypothetical protein